MTDRQLQNRRALTLAQLSHQHVAAVRKLDRVVVSVRHMRVDLAELAHPAIDGASPYPAAVVLNVIGERQLGSRKHTNSNGQIFFGSKAAGRGAAEGRGDKRLADFRGAR